MTFYDPENFTDPLLIASEKKERFLQPLWDLILRCNHDVLSSGLFPGMMGISLYFTLVAVFTVLDIYGQKWAWLQKYKIQPNKQVTWSLVYSSMVIHFWNHVLYLFPLNVASLIWQPPTPLPPVAPTVWSLVWQVGASWVIFDFVYWAYHVVHHKYHATFAAMAQYLHPSEILYIGITASTIPWLFRPHILTYWTWIIVSVITSIEDHCGYDIPLMPHKFLPFYGGAPKHDMHHMRPMSNFEPFFNHLDKIFGWDMTLQEIRDQKKKSAEGLHDPTDDVGIIKFN